MSWIDDGRETRFETSGTMAIDCQPTYELRRWKTWLLGMRPSGCSRANQAREADRLIEKARGRLPRKHSWAGDNALRDASGRRIGWSSWWIDEFGAVRSLKAEGSRSSYAPGCRVTIT